MANISEISIKRPVLSTVMMLILLLFGMIGYKFLGVREFPSVDNQIISVNVSYPGANAEVIMNQITEPLEQNINGIPGIRSLSSVSSQGSSRITVEFELSVDLETAANDVRDKVSRAQRYPPRDCDPPTVSKTDADATPIMQIGIRSSKRSLMELSEIAELTVKERLQTIPNVSGVDIWGQKRYSMRLWLDPIKMAGYGVTPLDVKNAVDAENVELPSGSIEGNTIDLSIRTLGLMHTAKEFNDLIIKRDGENIIRFQDVGRAEVSPEDLRSVMRKNGEPMVIDVIIPQPGANQIEIADEAYKRIEQLEKDLPDDVTVEMVYDNTRFIRASIKEVEETIYVAFLLVVLIIFLFLRDWRVTLVPVVVIPVSLVGAFFVMYVSGFSINVLTMLAVVLSVGLVVDDAIVMAENIYVRIEQGMEPKEAGIEGSSEIFFAVVPTTVTLVSVFLPIVFMEGMTGRLFKEFSIVIAGSVTISSFVALTFTPMLATKLLKKRENKGWLYTKTEPFFDGMNTVYAKALNAFLNHKLWAIPIIVILFGSIGYFWRTIRSDLSPLEDRSSISINIRAQEGATFEFIRDFTDQIAAMADTLAPERKALTVRANSGNGFISVLLPDIKDRKRSQMEIADVLSSHVREKTETRAFVQQQSTFGGRRGGMPVQYVLQATSLEKLQEHLPAFMQKVSESPVFQMADVNLKFTKPEARIEINRDKASSLGVSTRTIAQTLQYALSGQRMGYFYMNGKQYQILGEINRQQRNTPLDLKSIYVRSDAGEMIQLDNLVTLKEDVAPPQLYRYNRFVAATVSSGLNKGYTIGDGLDEMDRIAAETLDNSFRTALSGESKEFRESSSSLMFAMILALFMIYLVLAAQFESFKDPLVVMFTVPLAIAGALIFMSYSGVTMNIFSQIGIIMLIGLVAKNGILIVEFANQRQEAGLSMAEAIRSAATQRLRPILMTSISTILGLVPLVYASGEGAQGRIAMGIAVVGGMIVSTFLTLFIVPAMYSFISTDRQKKLKLKIESYLRDMKRLLLLICIVFAVVPAGAQRILSLDDCIQTGLERNYSIRIIRNEQQVSDNNATPGNAGYLPTVDLSGGFSGSVNNNNNKLSDGTTEKTNGVNNETADVGLNVNWTVFDGLGIQATYDRLKELKNLGELNTRMTIEDFVADLSSEYYNLIRQKIRLRNLRSTLDLSRERLRIVEERYYIGSMSRLDLQQAQVDFNADSSNVLNQLEQVHTSRIRLNQLMALDDVEEQVQIKDSLITPNPLLDEVELWKSTLSSNSSLLIAKKEPGYFGAGLQEDQEP